MLNSPFGPKVWTTDTSRYVRPGRGSQRYGNVTPAQPSGLISPLDGTLTRSFAAATETAASPKVSVRRTLSSLLAMLGLSHNVERRYRHNALTALRSRSHRSGYVMRTTRSADRDSRPVAEKSASATA